MAVIREKRQYKIGTIGVARASQGGKMIGDTIARSANTLSDMFYRDAAQAAEKAGVEAASAAIVTFNPQTGEPEEYTPPEGMGSIGADAYQRVVMKRFQQSMEDEIRNKGKQLAFKYESSPNGAALYETAMSDYVASMTNAADDEFKGFISDVGKHYVSTTATNMGIAQMRRERAASKIAHDARVKDKLDQIENMVAQGGPASLQGPTLVNDAIADVSSDVGDGGQARIFNPAEINNYGKDGQMAIARGLIRNAASKITDPDELRLMQNAIGTQNANAVPEGYPEVADAIRSFGSDFSSLEKLEKFSDKLFPDAVVIAEINQQDKVEQQKAENATVINNMGDDLVGNKLAASTMGFFGDFLTTTKITVEKWNDSTASAQQQRDAGNEDVAEQITKNKQETFDSVVGAIYARTLSGLDKKDTEALQNAVFNKQVSLAPEKSRAGFLALKRLEERTGEPVLKNFISVIKGYGDGAAKHVGRINAANAAAEASQVDLNSILYASNPEETRASAIAIINNIPNLAKEIKDGMIKTVNINTAENFFKKAFSGTALEESEVAEARRILDGAPFVKGNISKERADLFKAARKYTELADDRDALTSMFSRQVESNNQTLKASRAAKEKIRIFDDIVNGTGDPNNKNHQDIVEEALTKAFPDFNLDAIFASAPTTESVQVLNQISKMGVMPTSLVNRLNSIGNGDYRGADLKATISHYISFKDYVHEGQVVDNNALLSLDPESKMMLDYIADSVDILGNLDSGNIAERLQRMNDFFDKNSNYKKTVETYLDEDLTKFVTNQVQIATTSGLLGKTEGPHSLPESAQKALETYTIKLVAMNVGVKEIQSKIAKQIQRTYPSGEGYVFNQRGGNRSKHALSLSVQGNEDIFKNVVLDRVSSLTNLKLVSFNQEKIKTDQYISGGVGQGGYVYKPSENTIYLKPFRSSDDGEVEYFVFQRRSLEDGGDIMVNGTFTFDKLGEKYVAPIIISNKDPQFLNIIEQNNLLAKEKSVAKAVRKEKQAEFYNRGTFKDSNLGILYERIQSYIGSGEEN